MKQIQLGLVAEEAGLVDGQILEQRGYLAFAVVADQQPVVAVEGVDMALAHAALHAVMQKMRAAIVEMHAALLVDEGLQKSQFGFRKRRVWGWCCAGCGHGFRGSDALTGGRAADLRLGSRSRFRICGQLLRVFTAEIQACSYRAA